jgi:hypothetical protein
MSTMPAELLQKEMERSKAHSGGQEYMVRGQNGVKEIQTCPEQFMPEIRSCAIQAPL